MRLPSVSSFRTSPSSRFVEGRIVVGGLRDGSVNKRTVVRPPSHEKKEWTGYQRLKWRKCRGGGYAPLPIMPENRIRLANSPELHLSSRIAIHIRVILFTELTRGYVCLVNGSNPRVRWVGYVPGRNLTRDMRAP